MVNAIEVIGLENSLQAISATTRMTPMASIFSDVESISIYPNPMYQERVLHVSLPFVLWEETVTMNLYNTTGLQLASERLINDFNGSYEVVLDDWISSGTYILQFSTLQKIENTLKLIIK